MSLGFDPRPRGNIEPHFDADDEVHAVKVAALDAGFTLRQAEAYAREARAALSMNPKNGQALWTMPDGRTLEGPVGRSALFRELSQRDELLAFGPDPINLLIGALVDRGATKQEAERLAVGRVKRNDDGSISYSPARQGQRHPEEPPRQPLVGDTDLIRQAAADLYRQLQVERRGAAITQEAVDQKSEDLKFSV